MFNPRMERKGNGELIPRFDVERMAAKETSKRIGDGVRTSCAPPGAKIRISDADRDMQIAINSSKLRLADLIKNFRNFLGLQV